MSSLPPQRGYSTTTSNNINLNKNPPRNPPRNHHPPLLPKETPASISHTAGPSRPPPPPAAGISHHHLQPTSQSQKRTRVLLSCAPCRTSKQKCDRQQPCKNCLKKAREDLCVYAPKPEKLRPERSMAARLKRLESMVRGMMHTDTNPNTRRGGGGVPIPVLTSSSSGAAAAAGQYTTDEHDDEDEDPDPEERAGPAPIGQVVLGKSGKGTTATYVGATHFMAMLEDIEDLKSYFDDDGEADAGEAGLGPDAGFGSPDAHSPGLLLLSHTVPTCKQDLIDMLPPQPVVERLIQRYFDAASPTHHCVHQPTFVNECAVFWQDPNKASLQWLALLFVIIAQGTSFSMFTAPQELASDSDVPPMERFRGYRAAALWALVAGKFSSPGSSTIQPFLLYIESEFLINRNCQMTCYLLISVCVRLMLRMGLHRDPDKLPNISPFDGEMRRRLWHVACQFDHLVSFHMGLPSMVYSIESDTALPRNLVDDDLSRDCQQLPPARPDTEYTMLTYPIWKSSICNVFGLVARQANSLTIPTYAQVQELDMRIDEIWGQVPPFMKRIVPPQSGEPISPVLVNQQFGLISLYNKSRCVLHRRYLIEPVPKPEHAYSRRICLEAAINLLDHQNLMHLATLPGGALRATGWYISALAIHDFLLAAMIVYLILQHEPEPGRYDQEENCWLNLDPNLSVSSTDQLEKILERSHQIWETVSQADGVFQKATDMLATMLKKIELKRQQSKGKQPETDQQAHVGDEDSWHNTSQSHVPLSVSSLSMTDEHWDPELGSEEHHMMEVQQPLTRQDLMPASMVEPRSGLDTRWLDLGMGMDQMGWDTFDSAIRGENSVNQQTVEDWIPEGPLLDDVQLMTTMGFHGPFDWGEQEEEYQG
ncbi:fungal-specific transcription factor domain-containing protein [Cercophora samala]|uniref:Fungal-specific transcription factor domain-containing protein n=1 Tax=Cercophora samala TaxID=330535 RepID=A0AA40D8S4_9PEZI|nr:fungal-specific transcription factor domain-containing protein [Cercophora samala]